MAPSSRGASNERHGGHDASGSKWQGGGRGRGREAGSQGAEGSKAGKLLEQLARHPLIDWAVCDVDCPAAGLSHPLRPIWSHPITGPT